MIMAGEEYMKEKPFGDVYFTGMVRDHLGRKMSKQLGNSPDLLDLINRFGADAVRFGILISAPAGNDLLFDINALEQGKYFNNKIWNALKLVKMWEERMATDRSSQSTDESFAVEWFQNRMNEVRIQVEELFRQFKLSEALKTIYSLVWDDFCSWYLEWIKPPFEGKINAGVYKRTIGFFTDLMQLLHPFMPFITEEIYHRLEERKDDLCMKQFKPTGEIKPDILQQGEILKQTISAIRDARNKNQVKPKETIRIHILTSTPKKYTAIESILSKQVNAESISYANDSKPNSIAVVVGADKFFIESEQPVDAGSQIEHLQKELEYQRGFLVSVEKKLSNERFVQNAKPEVVEIERKKKADAEEKIRTLEESLASLI
jgi:valyl-tRNA synthetase